VAVWSGSQLGEHGQGIRQYIEEIQGFIAKMKFSNITDHSFWDAKYTLGKTRYSLYDPLYGKRGLMAKTFLQWLNGANNVLEIGCGSSRYLMFFNMVAGLDTYGLDFSTKGLENLRVMAARHGIEHTLYWGDMFEQEVEGRKFDVVFHSGLVEHFSNLGLFFERCRFFCRDNSLMVFLVPNMQNMAWQWHRRLCPVNFRAHIRYTKEKITEALSPYFTASYVRPWGYPQIYAGGAPESVVAKVMKTINIGLIFWISFTVLGYKGSVNSRLASSWLFISRAR
jgi:2-polyprenyl-3-methyl-5-hydroxy-6-metoxy-1,4-benzoquinol methylase